MKNTYIELNQAFVDEVGEEKARAFADGVERAFDRLDARDHDRAVETVREEAAAAGVRMALPEAQALADQLLRFDAVSVYLPGQTPPEAPDPLASRDEASGDRR